MITELSLENFKSWEKITKMKFGSITGLFGTNSSGKTSILQLLLMLKQTVESPDRAQALIFGDDKTPANLGSFQEVVLGHAKPGSIAWRLKWDLPTALPIDDPADPKNTLFSSNELGFFARLTGENGRLGVNKMTYRFGGDQFSMVAKDETFERYDLVHEGTSFRFIREKGRAWELPAPVKCYGFPDQVKAYYQNAGFLGDLQLEFEKLFSGVYYLGPLRDYPKRQYAWAGSEPADMGQRGERVIDALLSSRQKGKYISIGRGRGKSRRTLEEHAAYWLKQLGLIYDFKIELIGKDSNLYRVNVQKSADSAFVRIPDVGFGVSQILPVLVICFYVPENSTIILEQPEIHLHPSVQAGLADVFIEAIKLRNVQIIFESHSEHLLRRLQRRIAEEEFEHESANLYFCEMINGHSSLSPLQLDLFGNIDNWPKDFFGDEFGEMAAITRAATLKRKRQEKTK